jgi:hypothetical protein
MAQTSRWPSFYIVGAPKAGTTSLYGYLADHPGIFVPDRKELRFFGSDLEIHHRRALSSDEFLAHYADAPPGTTLGNAYVWYLFSQAAAQEIHAVRPDARIIAMVREPAQALHALHSEFVYDGNESIESFPDALAAEPDRCQGRRIPPEAHFPDGLCYRRTVRYAEQLQRYIDRFGRGQVLVIVFDDFVADPRRWYEQTLAFLGVAGDGRREFPALNPNKRSRSSVLRRLLGEPPEGLRRLIRATVPPSLRRAAYRRAVALNRRELERAPLSAAVRRSLRHELAGEVAALEELLGRPLAAWREAE